MRRKRLLIGVLVLVVLLVAVSFVLFSTGGSTPGDGGGETVEESLGR